MMPPFPVIVSDPPWPFADRLGARGAEANYRTLSIDELCRLELPPIADDAILFQWRVASMVPEALEVTRAWGFEAKSEIVWHKVKPTGGRHVGMGRYVRLEHEVAIIATRGRATSLILDHGVPSVFTAPVGRHSEKPDAFFALVRRLAGGPYCELFGRRRRLGWTVMGDEIGAPLKVREA